MNIKTIIHIVLIVTVILGIITIAKIFLNYTFNLSEIHILLISLGVISYYNFLFHKKVFERLKRKRKIKEYENQQIEIITSFLETNLEKETIQELEEKLIYLHLRKFKEKILKKYKTQLLKKLEETKKTLEIKKHKNKINKLLEEQEDIKEKLEQAQEKLTRRTQTEKEKKEAIKEGFDLDQKVFYKEYLSQEEIEILLEENYTQSNEYCILEKKVVPVFVKKVLNHSTSHIFLQANIKEFLEYNYETIIENIQEHDTKDADITFKYKNRYYALEIETGTLLKKPGQLAEKINYLNIRYKNRWMFIITNKNNLSKYKKHGFATQRTDIEKNLNKLLKINTQ